MPLKFGVGTGDRVSDPAATSINDLDPVSYAFWIYPTSITGAQRLLTKGTGATGGFHLFAYDNVATSDLNWTVKRATANCNYVTNSAPVALAAHWYFVVVTFSSAATPTSHIYVGDLTVPAKECTYTVGSTDGSGGVTAQAAGQPLHWMNGGAAPANSFKGLCQVGAAYNAVLSLEDVQRLQKRTHPVTVRQCVDFHWFGAHGQLTVLDASGHGNVGAITGAFPTSDLWPSPKLSRRFTNPVIVKATWPGYQAQLGWF